MVYFNTKAREFTFGADFFRALKRLAPLLYSSPVLALFYTATTLATAGANEYITYHTGMLTGEFYKNFAAKDEKAVWHTFTKCSLYYAGQCLVMAGITLSAGLLYLSIRRNLMYSLHEKYFQGRNYYSLNMSDKHGIDNADQRMTQDVEKLCNTLCNNIMPKALVAPFVIGYYTWKTWHTAGGLGVGIIYGYFIIGTIANLLFLRPMTKWTGNADREEGNLRYKHVSVRVYAEECAFYRSEEFEKSESDRILEGLLSKRLRLVLWNFPVQFIQVFFDYYGGVLSYAIQIIPIFYLNTYKNKDSFAMSEIISNNAFVYIYLVNSFTRLTDLAVNLADLAVFSQRVAEVVEFCDTNEEAKRRPSEIVAFDNLDNDKNGGSKGGIISHPDSKLLIKMKGLTYGIPEDGTTLVNGLTLDVALGQKILVSGPSGVGKTSLLRVLAGLWEARTGTVRISRPLRHFMFLPQRPYLPTGGLSLKQQIYFPEAVPIGFDCEIENDRLSTLLNSVGLAHLIPMAGGIDSPIDFEWQDMLSPGEAQRLSICRLLFHRPQFAILDEATSSLGADIQKLMYTLISQEGIQYISTGHRTSLEELHDAELHLTKNDYTFKAIKPIERL